MSSHTPVFKIQASCIVQSIPGSVSLDYEILYDDFHYQSLSVRDTQRSDNVCLSRGLERKCLSDGEVHKTREKPKHAKGAMPFCPEMNDA